MARGNPPSRAPLGAAAAPAVLLVLGFLPRAERTLDLFFLELVRMLRAGNATVHLTFPEEPPAEYARRLEAAGGSWSLLPVPIRFWPLLRETRRLDRHRPRILETHFVPVDSLACTAVRALRGVDAWVPVLHSEVSLRASPLRRFVRRVRGGLAAPSRAAVVPVSLALGDLLARAGVPPSSIRTVRNGVALDQWGIAEPRRRPAGFHVVFAGQLLPDKGLPELLEAIDRLRADGREVTLSIAGEGPLREMRKARHLRWLGQVDDLDALFGSADAVAVPSHREGFGLVALEAMAAGVPVVTSTAGALPEVTGEAGLHHAVADVDALTDRLRSLADDPRLRARLGRAGQRRARRLFPLEEMVRGHASILAAAAHRVRSQPANIPWTPA
jgi:glycosyltransferase involved in cell wall biosynthesis